jgi:AraC family transcriptional regulator, dual regulator of chb operon
MRRLKFDAFPNRGRYIIADHPIGSGQVTFAHTQNFSEIFLVISGSGIHWINSRQESLSRGSLVFVDAVSRHYFESQRSLRLINLAFNPEWWDGYRIILWPPALQPALRTFGIKIGEKACRECESHLFNLLLNDGRDISGLVETTSVLLRHLFEPAPGEGLIPLANRDHVPPWLVALLAEMEAAPAPLENIAHWQRRSGRSPEHLARTFRHHLNCTLTEVIVRLRLEHVKRAIMSGDEKVMTTAFAAGFENLGYFYRRFRQLEGCSPKQWQARQINDTTIPRG